MRWIVQPILVLATCVFQLSAGPHIAFLDARPNLVLVGVVVWAIFGGLRNSLLWAILGGLVLDLYTAGPFGAMTTLLVLTSVVTSSGTRWLEAHTLFPPLVVAFVATIAFDTLLLIFYQTVGRPVDWGAYFFPLILPEAIYNGLLAGVAYFPLLFLHRQLQKLELR